GFCFGHVREYNHSYNFFAGMSNDDIARYQKDAVIGHRPTWKMGMNGGRPTTRSYSARFQPNLEGADDPLNLFRHFGPGSDGVGSDRLRQRAAPVIPHPEPRAAGSPGVDPAA